MLTMRVLRPMGARVLPATGMAGLILLLAGSARAMPPPSYDAAQMEITAFNRKFRSVTLRMDNAAVLALWAEDGVDLMPGMDPLIGKAAIRKWLDEVLKKISGYQVVKEEDDFHDIRVSGDWASEWGTTHQVIQPPGNEPPIETRGKILLVLHREKDGAWKIKMEMWTPGPPPKEQPSQSHAFPFAAPRRWATAM